MRHSLKPHLGWASLFLLALMFLSVAWSIEAAAWTDGLWTLQIIVLGGLLIGWLFGMARWLPALVSHLAALALGVVWTGFVVAYVPSLIPWDYTWEETIREMSGRLWQWIQTMRAGGMSADNLIFVLHVGFLMWLVAYLGSWSLYRLNLVWLPILLTGFALLTNLFYTETSLYLYFIVFCVVALLLVVRHYTFTQEREWHARRVGFNPDISWDFLRDGGIFTLVVVGLAWLVPTVSAAPEIYNELTARIEEPYTKWQTNFNRMFSALNYKPRPGPAYFSNTLALSGAVNLGDQPIFDAKTEGGIGARYWRSVAYDQYTGRGWVNSNTSITNVDPGDKRMSTVIYQARTVITQTVTMIQPGGSVVHAVSQPLSLGLGARAQYGVTEPIEITGESRPITPLDVSLINANRVWRPGDTFTIVSAQSVATVKQLREAGTEYPKWVRDKYLQAPESVTPRVKELAKQITAGADTPFDKAVAIERYLRQIPYNENISSPPPGQDLVDWFLFDMKQGYCDYYASSFNVLARSVGIPTRMAAGYSRGQFIEELGVLRQYEYDAHSWPEVYFPKYGWLEFEPTAADPTITRMDDTNVDDMPNLAELDFAGSDRDRDDLGMFPDDDLLANDFPGGTVDLNVPGAETGLRVPRLLAVPLLLLAILAAAAGLFWALWNRDLRGLNLVDRIWEQVLRFGRMLGISTGLSSTPHEVARAVAHAVPETEPDVTKIADVYVRQHFSPRGITTEEGATLPATWGRAQKALWQRWFGKLAERARPKWKK